MTIFSECRNSADNIARQTEFFRNFLVEPFKLYKIDRIRVLPKSKIGGVATV